MAFGRCVLIFAFLYAVPVESDFRFEDCSVENSIILLPTFDVLPDPVDLKDNMTITVRGQILKDIPLSAKLEVKYYGLKKIFGMQVDVLIPCILGKYGSCTLSFCDYMERFKKQICPFFANETSCDCPPKAGSYDGYAVEVEMAKPSAITRLLAKGKYRTEMRLRNETGEELACFKFYTELT